MQKTPSRDDRVAARDRSETWIVKGALSGVVAGVVMATYVMLAAELAGDGFWIFPRTVTGLFLGEHATDPGFDAATVLTGIIVHLVLSALFGVHCAVIIGFFTNSLPLAVLGLDGVFFGLVLWGFNTLIVAPFLPGDELVHNLVFLETIPSWSWATGNVLYGAILGLLYGWWRDGDTTIIAR